MKKTAKTNATKKKKSAPLTKRSLPAIFKNKTVLVLICLNLAAILVLIGVAVRKIREENAPLYYSRYIESACEEFDVPKDVVLAVIRVESDFRADARSKAGARGLMQITENTLKDINYRLGTSYSFLEMYDAKTNIRCGTFYLSYLYNRFGDYETVYAAYNAGPTIVSEWLKDDRYTQNGKLVNIPYPETAKYVEKVVFFRKEYINLYEEILK